MQPDELDRILGTEDAITPSPGFAAAVMKKVLATAESRRSIEFPWRPMCYGWMAAIAAVGTAVYGAITAPRPVSPIEAPAIAGVLARWTTHTTELAMSPATGALALALIVLLLPVAVYEIFERARD